MSETDKVPEVQKKVFHKRKKLNLKVKQDFQLWLLTRITMTALFSILLATVLIYLYARGVVDTEFLGFKPNVRKVSEVMLPILLATALTSTIAGLLLALFLPQKIAGPIFRIEQDLLAVRTGDLTKVVNLRCADILKELAETINMTVADVGYMVQDIKKSGRSLELKINEGDTDAIKEALENHLEQIDRIKTNP
jgi:methyl-accepting chemotaxis protein